MSPWDPALIEAACAARQQAHAPYSGFRVGAALATAAGRIFSGCNVENASYGLTICAERVAVASAVAAGYRDFTALAVAASPAAPPCGACRQVLAEFCRELPILLVDAEDPQHVREVLLSRLLPERFDLAAMRGVAREMPPP